MSDNGYKESTFNVQISEVIKEIHKSDYQIFSLNDTATIGDAIELMNKESISQIPIIKDGNVCGVVTEKELLKPLYEGEYKTNDSVSLILNSKFITVDQSELVSQITDKLINRDSVIVLKDGTPISILTNIDILEFISKNGTY